MPCLCVHRGLGVHTASVRVGPGPLAHPLPSVAWLLRRLTSHRGVVLWGQGHLANALELCVGVGTGTRPKPPRVELGGLEVPGLGGCAWSVLFLPQSFNQLNPPGARGLLCVSLHIVFFDFLKEYLFFLL